MIKQALIALGLLGAVAISAPAEAHRDRVRTSVVISYGTPTYYDGYYDPRYDHFYRQRYRPVYYEPVYYRPRYRSHYYYQPRYRYRPRHYYYDPYYRPHKRHWKKRHWRHHDRW